MATPFGGFNFGNQTRPTSSQGGLSFGSSATTKPTGFAIGTPAQTSATTLTGLLTAGQTTTAPSFGGFNFGGAGSTTTTANSSLSFGNQSSLSSSGFQLGGLKTTTTQPSGGFNFGSTATKPATTQTGLSFGGTPSLGLSFGSTNTATTSQAGQSFGSSATGSGFKLGGTTTSSSGFGSLGGGLGGGLNLGSTAATSGSITTTASKGLGGITLTSSAASTTTSSSGSSSDSKVLLDSMVPADICNTVTGFKEYVKKQKTFKDDIASFSDKPLHMIREDTTALKQLLAVLDSAFQRNAASIHRLKEESCQILKDAEIAQRTKEIPLGLQGENYAPAEYFQRLVLEFEEQFQQYRQLIEELEHQMSTMNQQASHTPQELSTVMVKLNETFIALAAQLQSVHDLVKAQKEQYLTYRRVFLHESKDVFAARKKALVDQKRIKSAPTGSRAFEGTSSAAALAMVTALDRQQTAAASVGGTMPPGVGFGTTTGGGLNFGPGSSAFGSTGLGAKPGTLGGGFGTGFGGTGSTFGTTGSTFGTTGSTFGTPGSTFGTGLFGKPATTSGGLSFGGSLSAGPLGTTSTGFGGFGSNAAAGTSFGTTTTGKPLQLQKPPNKFRKGAR